jgi:DNA-directed RNA polymerase specialized sigma24 family protein
MLTETQLLAVRPIVRSVARGYPNAGEVEDLTQEVMLRLWEARSTFTGTDAEAMHFAGRVARRVCIDLARSSAADRRRTEYFTARGGFYPRAIATPEETYLACETVGRLLEKKKAGRAEDRGTVAWSQERAIELLAAA